MRHLFLFVLIALTVIAGTAYAHHSFPATYQINKTITIEGKVTQLLFRNPHSLLQVEGVDANGQMKKWSLEWGGRGTAVDSGRRERYVESRRRTHHHCQSRPQRCGFNTSITEDYKATRRRMVLGNRARPSRRLATLAGDKTFVPNSNPVLSPLLDGGRPGSKRFQIPIAKASRSGARFERGDSPRRHTR